MEDSGLSIVSLNVQADTCSSGDLMGQGANSNTSETKSFYSG